MITPPYLKKGDAVAIVSPARKISPQDLQSALDKLKTWGLEVIVGKNCYNSFNQFAGTDTERVTDLQEMLDDTDIKAVFCARGGYGTVRIIDQLDFSAFKLSPKWIVGFSDATVLHSHIHTNFSIESLHAVMSISFPKSGQTNNALETLRKALFGEVLSYTVEVAGTYGENGIQNRLGTAEASLIGGNLSLLYALIASPSDIDTDGKILFLEDLDEYLYHVDRMIINLKRTGKLKNLMGLIIGGMTEMKDNTIPFGKTAEEIIWDAVKEYKYPVCFGFPAGHLEDNRALIMGRRVKLKISREKVELGF